MRIYLGLAIQLLAQRLLRNNEPKETIETETDSPAADTLAQSRSTPDDANSNTVNPANELISDSVSGPPAHWLELVSRHAPGLLRPKNSFSNPSPTVASGLHVQERSTQLNTLKSTTPEPDVRMDQTSEELSFILPDNGKSMTNKSLPMNRVSSYTISLSNRGVGDKPGSRAGDLNKVNNNESNQTRYQIPSESKWTSPSVSFHSVRNYQVVSSPPSDLHATDHNLRTELGLRESDNTSQINQSRARQQEIGVSNEVRTPCSTGAPLTPQVRSTTERSASRVTRDKPEPDQIELDANYILNPKPNPPVSTAVRSVVQNEENRSIDYLTEIDLQRSSSTPIPKTKRFEYYNNKEIATLSRTALDTEIWTDQANDYRFIEMHLAEEQVTGRSPPNLTPGVAPDSPGVKSTYSNVRVELHSYGDLHSSSNQQMGRETDRQEWYEEQELFWPTLPDERNLNTVRSSWVQNPWPDLPSDPSEISERTLAIDDKNILAIQRRQLERLDRLDQEQRGLRWNG